MEGSSGPSKWMWLVPLVSLAFLVLALTQGAILSALGWSCLLANGVLVASGLHRRSRALSYLALAFVLLGLLLLIASIAREFGLPASSFRRLRGARLASTARVTPVQGFAPTFLE